MEQILRNGVKVVLLGKTGVGKSSTGNTILGKKAFLSKKRARSVTQEAAVSSGAVGFIPVTVYDTPGFYDTDMSEDEVQKKIENVLQECDSGPSAFLLVIRADRFTAEERQTVEKIEKLLGEKRLKKTWILFTRGDELEGENMTIQEFLNETEPLKNLVQKYDQRFHVFNNMQNKDTKQVETLIIKLLESYFTITDEEIPNLLQSNPLMRKMPEVVVSDPDRRSPSVTSLPSRRIVLLGKSGVGKSAAGNTILQKDEFTSALDMSSVTRSCSEAHTTASGRSLSVVDTPGLFDTQMKPEELMTEIMRSVYLSSPGPHAFLIVLRLDDRFTEHEQQIPQMIKLWFGQEVLKYSIILFTHGDSLGGASIETLIRRNCAIRDLIDQCGGRYHIFNNRDKSNRQQLTDLLKKIDTMIEQNGGTYYSNQMFEDAQKFRQQEEEQKKQQLKKKNQDFSQERMREEIEKKVRAEFETKMKCQPNTEVKKQTDDKSDSGFIPFLSKYWPHCLKGLVMVAVLTGAAVGAVILAGAGAGVCALACAFSAAAAGKVGVAAAAGAVVGGFAGGVVGAKVAKHHQAENKA